MIEAFQQVKTNKKLVIAGGSSDTDSFMQTLKEMAKEDDRMLFTGFVLAEMLLSNIGFLFLVLICLEIKCKHLWSIQMFL